MATEPETPKVRFPRFEIHVSQAEIDTAIPANSGHCMIADAVKHCFVDKYKRIPVAISVDLQTIRFTDPRPGLRFIFLTPVVAQRALLQFDQGIKPTPFRFRLSSNGAQVIPTKRQPRKGQTPAQQAAQKKASSKGAAAKKRQAKLRRGKVVIGHQSGGNHATKVGGKAPPPAVLSGNRRQFGIRAAGVLDGPTQAQAESDAEE